MKVLRINQTDITGGAAIAINRLHQGLVAKGIDSRYLVSSARSSSKSVELLSARWIDCQIGRLTRSFGFNEFHLTSTFKVAKHPFYIEADILHLHNLHAGYFNYLALPSLTKNKPAILTLHDMWAFTGHCAYSFKCDRWKTGCGHCPDLKTYPSVKRDSTQWEWKLKRWVYKHSNIKAVVTTSRWMTQQAKQSILSHLPVYRIPPGLDLRCYKPLNSKQCRELLGIPSDQFVLLSMADRLNDPRKGGKLLIQSLNALPPTVQARTTLITLGYGAETLTESVNLETLNLGFVSSDRLKAIIYSAADIFLFPTCAENFGLVAQEAIACATPVIAFQVGGVSDIIQSGTNGLLVEPENTREFSNAIISLLEDRKTRQQMGKEGRKFVEAEYSVDRYVQLYIDLYQNVLNPFRKSNEFHE